MRLYHLYLYTPFSRDEKKYFFLNKAVQAVRRYKKGSSPVSARLPAVPPFVPYIITLNRGGTGFVNHGLCIKSFENEKIILWFCRNVYIGSFVLKRFCRINC